MLFVNFVLVECVSQQLGSTQLCTSLHSCWEKHLNEQQSFALVFLWHNIEGKPRIEQRGCVLLIRHLQIGPLALLNPRTATRRTVSSELCSQTTLRLCSNKNQLRTLLPQTVCELCSQTRTVLLNWMKQTRSPFVTFRLCMAWETAFLYTKKAF